MLDPKDQQTSAEKETKVVVGEQFPRKDHQDWVSIFHHMPVMLVGRLIRNCQNINFKDLFYVSAD